MSEQKVFSGSSRIIRILMVCSSLLLPGFLWVLPSCADDSERMEKLEREVQELKSVVNQLVEENRSLKASQEASSAKVESFAAVPVPLLSSKEGLAPSLNIRGFGHAQYDFSRSDYSDDTQGDTNHFTNGGVDLFITSKVAEKISFLNETVFEFGSNGANVLDVERVLLKYDLQEWLNIAVGRGHTAIGYWNQNFHHGTWLQTTTARPLIHRFEDDGGILPVHYVGLEFSGTLDAPGGSLSYASNVANGRGTITDEVQLIEDDNDSKMAGIQLTYEPQALEGLGVGASYLHDVIPDKAGTTDRGAEIDEDIYGTHLFYTLLPYELLAEATFVDHYNRDTRLRNVTAGGYVQLAYAINKYKPYFRYDWLWLDDADPFFSGVQDEVGYTTGLRYELSAYNAVKMEYRYVNKDDEYKNEFTLQSSFAF
ncbi:MAG: bZIP transcription factor [Candidatus Omnitrophica bacterium]|nr:bZIP transcription factor [Candidatus Omnitrophota bacterium]